MVKLIYSWHYKTNKAAASIDVAGITIKWPPGIRFDDLHRCWRSSNYTLAFVRNCTQQYILTALPITYWRSVAKITQSINFIHCVNECINLITTQHSYVITTYSILHTVYLNTIHSTHTFPNIKEISVIFLGGTVRNRLKLSDWYLRNWQLL